jgi:hypothetical protein
VTSKKKQRSNKPRKVAKRRQKSGASYDMESDVGKKRAYRAREGAAADLKHHAGGNAHNLLQLYQQMPHSTDPEVRAALQPVREQHEAAKVYEAAFTFTSARVQAERVHSGAACTTEDERRSIYQILNSRSLGPH